MNVLSNTHLVGKTEEEGKQVKFTNKNNGERFKIIYISPRYENFIVERKNKMGDKETFSFVYEDIYDHFAV